MSVAKTLRRLLRGTSDAAIRFADLYQVKQVRAVVLKYKLGDVE